MYGLEAYSAPSVVLSIRSLLFSSIVVRVYALVNVNEIKIKDVREEESNKRKKERLTDLHFLKEISKLMIFHYSCMLCSVFFLSTETVYNLISSSNASYIYTLTHSQS